MPDASELISRDAARPPYFLAIDVGGTNLKFGIVDDNGHTLGRCSVRTAQERGPEDACQRMNQVGRKLATDCAVDMGDVARVGLATPGTMDVAAGMLLQPHNLPAWWNFPIRAHLESVIGKPVSFANDANAAAYGEFWVGSGAAFRSMVFFTLGTGVGGGIILDGRSVDGQHSHGSECGHMYVDSGPAARMCGCGQPGHLEAYVSANAVVRRTREALQRNGQSSIADRLEAGEELTPLLVAQEAERDDRLALEIVMETAMFLSLGVVNMMHIIDPDAVILGGAMNFGGHDTNVGRSFLERIRHEVRMRAFPALVDVTYIDFAVLGGHAGYIGAAGIARSHYQS